MDRAGNILYICQCEQIAYITKIQIYSFSESQETGHLFGTVFSCGLINIWCSSHYLWQQDSICVTDSK